MFQVSGIRMQHSTLNYHPSSFIPHPSSYRLRPPAYTLVEILVAMAITMILLAAVVQLFAKVGESITDSRSMLEASERLRSAAARLQMDLQGKTVALLPPRNPADGEGYFEYIEGPVVQGPSGDVGGPPLPVNSEISGNPLDTSAGDFDDILMFTTQSNGRPFVGMFNYGTAATPDVRSIQSDVAEVAWFIRGRTLHRRQLLVAPGVSITDLPAGFYARNDLSVRLSSGGILTANTLGDLTRRECRFAHLSAQFPFNARVWGNLGLPTLRECSDLNWNAGIWSGSATTTYPDNRVDFWANSGTYAPFSDSMISDGSGNTYSGTRIADDVILTNVIGFDVKAWDPGAGAYVDLGSGSAQLFAGNGDSRSQLAGGPARVYDTWSTHYENVGLTGFDATTYPPGRSTNGFDDDGNGIVDDEAEKITSPPYPVPLRGIQVKIRIFEPDSRQIRELTVVQDFLPK
jgi:type II secretory pathway pseudopilin PulG